MRPFLGIAMAIAAAPAFAQAGNHAEACIAGTGSFDLDITFCSLAIQSGAHRGIGRATLLSHRGRARLELGDRDGAVADFDAALQLNPASALAHNERGRAHHKAGDNARAIADYDAALALFPHYGAAYRNRGTARIFEGSLAAAIADFDAALASVSHDPASRILRGVARYLQGDYGAALPDLAAALDMAYPYPEAVLWIYLASRGDGEKGRTRLIENAREMSEGTWPDPLVEAYLGERSPQSALAAAHHPRAAKKRRQRTQAYFYLGQLALLRGDKAVARDRFDAVIRLGAVDLIEYAGATLELRRMAR